MDARPVRSERGAAGAVRVAGRFAPTPSGPLHFGSVVSALASALDARTRGGAWYLRIDDLDRRREAPGATRAILLDLERLGFAWDGAVQHQRNGAVRYRAALERLRSHGAAFDCCCSRREIAAAGIRGPEGPIYPGTCRDGPARGRPVRSTRLRTPQSVLGFDDEWQGPVSQDLGAVVGDFVVWRAEGIAAYHLATVVDDAELGVTRVVRGADLLASTPRQILLQQLLELPVPAYAHHPLVMAASRKLGKQTHAARVQTGRPAATLVAALEFLRQTPPPDLGACSADDVWRWAAAHWQPGRLRA